MDTCNICQSPLGRPVYESSTPVSITSLCQVLEGHTRVRHCPTCDHMQTEPLPALDRFYAEDYHILTASEGEDQLYEVRNGEKIYRTQHQAATLTAKVEIPENAKILDYGCGKAATLKALCAEDPGIEPSVFDVGEQYRAFWDTFVPQSQQAVDQTPADWRERFDLVTSFYASEHVADPRGALKAIHALLREGGTFYFIVPNVFANTADFVVADHVNHFSERSLRTLLTHCGFRVEEIDAEAHTSAWVGVARKGSPTEIDEDAESLAEVVAQISGYWREFGDCVRAFETDHVGPSAIYGSGFYGTFIHTCLVEPDRIECFLDQNPFRQSQRLLGLPILEPNALPDTVKTLYVGLNPRIAREAIAALGESWRESRECFFP